MTATPPRATISREFLDAARTHYGLTPDSAPRELGESFNLNVLVRNGKRDLVVRVYRQWMTVARLEAVQHIRRFLHERGLPFARTCPTVDGRPWCEAAGHLVEAEEFVGSDTYMDTAEHIRIGLALLGRIHSELRRAPASPAAATPPHANHVEAMHLVGAVAAGLAVVRQRTLAGAETRYAAQAEALARRLEEVESPFAKLLPRQLVHGDYWDDNVRFSGDRVVLVTDLDFMGWRPRIDDLALTLFYTNERLGRQDTSPSRFAQLRTLVDGYDASLDVPLSITERQALPYAIARTPLCFIAQLADDAGVPDQADRLHQRGPAFEWALDMISTPEWRTAFL
ncbi:phosphotransferase enzyme family protein [Actinopolymorpha alba]|uniref:phosphotransferase enzyme family protein n=1 Tax=Actinopolymorpha alba TaxID=533267 RepID=UPI000370B0FF|nr:phosphotransferase [Actinopolymorpha alba]